MNEPIEDLTQDDQIAAPLSVVDKPKSEFTRPKYCFKGLELFAASYGYVELLFTQVRDKEDTGIYTWLAFVYLLRKRHAKETAGEHLDWATEIAWDVKKYHRELKLWIDEVGLTIDDKLEAKRIYEESMKAAAETSVEVVPDRKRSVQKKTRHRKKHSSSTSSEGS